jgi:predicted metal-dependent phosphotriesterase family hydrolase
VVVSHDSVWCWRGEPLPRELLAQATEIWNPTHFARRIVPQLRDGGATEAQIDALTTENPRRFFAGEALGPLAA